MFYVLDTTSDVRSFQKQRKHATNSLKDFYTFPPLLSKTASKKDKAYYFRDESLKNYLEEVTRCYKWILVHL